MKRPFSVTFLALIVVFTAVGNGLRLGEAVFFWKILEEFGANPLYISISGGTWLVAGIVIGYGLWRGRAWSWAAAFGGAAIYGFWYWFDRLVLQEPHANWPFALAFTVLLAGFFAFILFSPKTRAYFNKQETSHE
ncbi:MAG: hypothetical protein NTW99_10350 [Chloroflexi bacterium]|nr:hypothetical protein [Chloroflexota bacterium]